MEFSTLATELQKRVPHRILPKQTGKPQSYQIREIQKLLEENPELSIQTYQIQGSSIIYS